MICRDLNIDRALQSRQRQRSLIEGCAPRVNDFVINSYSGAGGASAGDPFFSNVSLLMHGDTSPFVDSGPLGYSALNTAVTLDTTNKVFGAGAMSFNGSTSRLRLTSSLTPFQVGAGNFTIEFWFRTASVAAGQFIFWYGNDGNFNSSLFCGVAASGGLFAGLYDNAGVGDNINSSTGIIATNTWYFVSVARGGGRFFIHLNGSPVATAASSRTVGTPNVNPSVNVSSNYNTTYGANYFGGQIDDFRFTRATARYVDGASYLPPSSPFPNS